ncbi:MAG TPA: flagellar basal body P-ring formation chaperone FlgA [Phycisphaerales bacterium]|nr:flagellar basal body P-ring formation chaperone FlgA [Phycisphaerales bacterium]
MTWKFAISVLAAIAILGVRCLADTVSVRATATVPTGAPVLLADIADIEGESVAATGAVVVLDAAAAAKRRMRDGVISIELSEVRRALAGASGVNMGRIALSGSAVAVRVSGDGGRSAPTAVVTAEYSGETIGGVLPGALAKWLSIRPEDIQVDTSAVDPAVLRTPVGNRTYTVTTSSRGDVLPVQVRVFEGDKPVLTQTIRVGVKVRRDACIAARDIKRGETLGAADFRVEPAWTGSGTSLAEAALALGATARSAIKTGSIIEDRQVDHPPTVQRGDLVNVDCLSGSVMLRATMRAREDGKVGDVVWFDPVAKARATRGTAREPGPGVGGGPVRARIAGAGRAVTVAGEGTGVAEENAPEDPGEAPSGSASVGTVDVRRLSTGQ